MYAALINTLEHGIHLNTLDQTIPESIQKPDIVVAD